ncbi:MAG TPA: heme ABC transporter ATP-binding protein [Acidimicrobiales bacterium]|jgi:iron complex transport system ATP-binding protein|nr:heme ABC transporter ATP-binding protein [Acidimicrobiales bacterium]
MSVVLECRDAGYRAGRRWLVSQVSLTVEAGEVLAVAGPNGAGKSTLLGLLAGDLRPSAGAVVLRGRDLSRYRAPELARIRAVLPQASLLQFAFTGRQVVELGRAPWCKDRSADDEKAVAAAMAATEVAALADRSYPSLSGGEASRVCLARVLAQETAVVLLDEPTASLDLRHQELTMTVARGLAARGGAVVAVLHDLNLAAAHADRVAVMDGGRLAAIGAPVDVLTDELLSDVYGHPVAVVTHPRRGCPLVLAGG